MVTEHFVKDTNNVITLTLTENGVGISGTWTSLEIRIGGLVTITRSSDGDGITLNTTTGVLTIDPGDLLAAEKAAYANLLPGNLYRTYVSVFDSGNDDGVDFGADDSEDGPLFFLVSDPT